jgi:phosphotransferase system  glucose/maltose/N-acetylglucosamine-specific IIC component
MKTMKKIFTIVIIMLFGALCGYAQEMGGMPGGRSFLPSIIGFIVLVGLILLPFICLSNVVGKLSERYGRSYWKWFFISLLISPFLAMICLYALGKTDEQERWDIEQDEKIRIETRKKHESRGIV